MINIIRRIFTRRRTLTQVETDIILHTNKMLGI